jgi:CopG family nickel-responsive transcriptional regulator
MQRVTITLDEDLLEDLDRMIAARGYQNRSEAIRDLARAGLQQAKVASGNGECVAALIYVYDHSARDLSKRLTQSFHHHHDISMATLHVHLDDDSCMEVTALKGATGEVQHFADHIIAERGVRYGQLVTIPAGEHTAKPHHHHSAEKTAHPQKPKVTAPRRSTPKGRNR